MLENYKFILTGKVKVVLAFFLIQLVSGCSSINSVIDDDTYAKHRSTPLAAHHSLLIDGVKRDYFFLELKDRFTNKKNKVNEHLIIQLSGSGCGDSQPLLSFLYNMPLNADIAVIQKRGVKTKELSDSKKCSKEFHEDDNLFNRTKDNLQLLAYLKKLKPYNKVSLLGVSEGVQVAYLMMNKEPSLREAVLLANHASASIEDSFILSLMRKIEAQKLSRKLFHKKINDWLKIIKEKGNDNKMMFGGLIKNTRIDFNLDKRNTGEVLSGKKENRYLFIMGEKDDYVPSSGLVRTKKIFCKNKHRNNLMLLKKGADHIVLRRPRYDTHKIIVDWLNHKSYVQNPNFKELSCE